MNSTILFFFFHLLIIYSLRLNTALTRFAVELSSVIRTDRLPRPRPIHGPTANALPFPHRPLLQHLSVLATTSSSGLHVRRVGRDPQYPVDRVRRAPRRHQVHVGRRTGSVLVVKVVVMVVSGNVVVVCTRGAARQQRVMVVILARPAGHLTPAGVLMTREPV